MFADRSARRRGGRRRSRLARTGILAFASGLGIALYALVPGSSFSLVHAVDQSGIFELDGNTTHDNANANGSPVDWNDLFDSSGNPKAPGGVNPLISSFFASDPSSNDLGFKGGSKEFSAISDWTCNDHPNPPKDEITHGYGAVFQAANTAGGVTAGDTVLYLGFERAAGNGDTNEGIWFFQDPTVHCTINDPNPVVAPGGFAFAGAHQNGDLFINIEFSKGGKVNAFSLFEWPDVNNPVIADAKCGANANDPLCGVVNDGGAITTPWSGSVDTNAFTEVGIDLNAIFKLSNANLPCFSQFQADTRASGSGVPSELKDFLSHGLQTCRNTETNTQLSTSSAVVGAPVSDTATVTINNDAAADAAGGADTDAAGDDSAASNPGGTVTFSIYSGTDATACTKPNLVQGGTVGPVPVDANGNASSGNLNLPPGSYEVQAAYSGNAATRYLASTSACGTEPLTITKVTPKLATTASATTSIGGTISDVASVTNGFSPGDNATVTWNLYGPFADGAAITASSCDKAHDLSSQLSAGFTKHAADSSDAVSATYNSPNFTTITGGQYVWVAHYSGNTNNAPVNGACTDANEVVQVNGPNSSLTKGERDLGANAGATDDPATPAYVTDINPAQTGDVLQYQLVYSNNGNGSTSNIVVTDPIPTGTSLLSAASCLPNTGNGWALTSCTATSVVFTHAAAVAGGTTGLTVGTFKVRINATGAFTISNVAGVTSGSESTSLPSNTVTAEGPVPPTGAVLGTTATNNPTTSGGVAGTTANNNPTSGVAGVAVSTPNTGANVPFGLGLGMMLLGTLLTGISRRRAWRSRAPMVGGRAAALAAAPAQPSTTAEHTTGKNPRWGLGVALALILIGAILSSRRESR